MVQKIKAATVLKLKLKTPKNMQPPTANKTATPPNTCFYASWFVLLMTGLLSPHSQADTLKICYDQWAPMTIFPTAAKQDRGVVIDMMTHIYQAQGYSLEYYEVPLARGLDMVAEGLCDVLPEYLYSKNAEQKFEFAQQPTFSYNTAFVIRKNDPWHYQGIESVKGKRIATGPGWDYSFMSAEYQNYLDNPSNANFVEVIAGYDDVIDRIFTMINENRIDLYADNELVLQYVLTQLGLEKSLKIVYPGLENPQTERPIFSRKISPEKRQSLIKIWNDGRLNMKGEQENKILKKYQVSFDKF